MNYFNKEAFIKVRLEVPEGLKLKKFVAIWYTPFWHFVVLGTSDDDLELHEKYGGIEYGRQLYILETKELEK